MQLKQLYEQLLRNTLAEQAGCMSEEQHSGVEVAEFCQQLDLQNSSVQEWEGKYTHLDRELKRVQSTTELECHQAATRKCVKWEVHEEHLIGVWRALQHWRRRSLMITPPTRCG